MATVIGRSAGKDRRAATSRRRGVLIAGSGIPPLQWWRHLPAEDFTDDHLRILRRALAGIGMVGEPRWADAVDGHAASAVGIALQVMKARRPLTPVVDLTMSTVLITAIRGDAAAITVLVAMIERRGAAGEKGALTRSWLNRQRKRAYGHDRAAGAARNGRTFVAGA